MKVSGLFQAPAVLTRHRERAVGSHWIGGRVDPNDSLVVLAQEITLPGTDSDHTSRPILGL
jgi:hypothetical protein